MTKDKDKDLSGLENLEVEPLSDDDLETVAGGEDCTGCLWCSDCTGGEEEIQLTGN